VNRGVIHRTHPEREAPRYGWRAEWMTMQHRQFGNSDMAISPIGIGAWAMGGEGWPFAWGPQQDRDSLDAIDAAVDCGVNWIDVSPVYGLGHAEEVVGRAMARHRNRLFVFTKCGIVANEQRQLRSTLKADSIRRECETSLTRLNVDAIDLYQVHWPNPDAELEEGWCEVLKLKDEGKIRWAGASNFRVEHAERCRRFGELTSLQPPYSVITPDAAAELLPYCQRHNIGVIVYSPMKSGLLSGSMTRERIASLPESDFRRRAGHFKEPELTRNLALVDLMAGIGARHGQSAGAVAVAWTLHHPAVTGAIVGFRSRAQVGGIVRAIDFRLTQEEVDEIAGMRQRSLAVAG
jgi:aryl-alcohol dehydrogenase-like predicted oxidoreductase